MKANNDQAQQQNRTIQLSLTLLRVVAGFLFFQAGALKLFGWYGGMPDGKTVTLFSQMGVGSVLEIVGGLALIVGLGTRPIAFVIAGEMAVAYWQFHFATTGGWPVQNQGVAPVLFCFIFLFFAANGAGSYSLDAWLKKSARFSRASLLLRRSAARGA